MSLSWQNALKYYFRCSFGPGQSNFLHPGMQSTFQKCKSSRTWWSKAPLTNAMFFPLPSKIIKPKCMKRFICRCSRATCHYLRSTLHLLLRVLEGLLTIPQLRFFLFKTNIDCARALSPQSSPDHEYAFAFFWIFSLLQRIAKHCYVAPSGLDSTCLKLDEQVFDEDLKCFRFKIMSARSAECYDICLLAGLVLCIKALRLSGLLSCPSSTQSVHFPRDLLVPRACCVSVSAAPNPRGHDLCGARLFPLRPTQNASNKETRSVLTSKPRKHHDYEVYRQIEVVNR